MLHTYISEVSLMSWREDASLALVGHPSGDGVTKISYGLYRCFIALTSLVPPSFPIGLVKTKSDFIVSII